MGINVQLVTETGVVREEILDDKKLLARLFESAPDRELSHCIQYIDPYGDTVFNVLQMARFLQEWKQLESLATSPRETILVRDIQILATICKDNVHLYLKFVGD